MANKHLTNSSDGSNDAGRMKPLPRKRTVARNHVAKHRQERLVLNAASRALASRAVENVNASVEAVASQRENKASCAKGSAPIPLSPTGSTAGTSQTEGSKAASAEGAEGDQADDDGSADNQAAADGAESDQAAGDGAEGGQAADGEFASGQSYAGQAGGDQSVADETGDDQPVANEAENGQPVADQAADQSDRKTKRRWPGILLRVLLAAFAIAALILLCTEQWLFNNWAALSIDEILYHLHASLTGTNNATIVDYMLRYGTTEIIGAAAIIAALVVTRKRFSATVQRVAMAVILVFGIGAAGFAIQDFDSRVGLFSYLDSLSRQSAGGAAGESEEQADFVGAHYIDTGMTDIAFPASKRNLIFIYLESMELTFADKALGGAFSENVIPELCTLASEGECFNGGAGELNGGHALPGTTWTTGAMFGSMSGTPLKLPFNSSELSTDDDFFPAMVTLGDILDQQGYEQVLMIGSEAAFGGRDLLYSAHGDFSIEDYNYAIENGMIPEDYFVWWGYEDRKLFSFARDRLQQLAAGSEPFNLTLLTVDTHFPDGWPCPLCRQSFEEQYSNVYACSSKQVTAFVRWIQKQEFYKNTTIVIMGDHPTMDTDYCNDVPADYDRRVLTTIINPAPEALAAFDASARREYSTLDLFPTTLASLGAQIRGNRLGLGANLFSSEPTIIERYGLDTCNEELEKPSSFLESFTDARITLKHMANAAAWDRLEIVTEDDGTLTFDLIDAALNSSAVDDVKITVTDSRTGISRALSATASADPSDPNHFHYTVHTGMTEKDLPYISLSATMSAGHFRNYPICKLDPQVPEAEDESEGEVGAEGEGEGATEDGGMIEAWTGTGTWAEAESENEAEAMAGDEGEAEGEAGDEGETEAETGAEGEANAGAESEAGAEAEDGNEAGAEAEGESGTGADAEVGAKAGAEDKARAEAGAAAESDSQSRK